MSEKRNPQLLLRLQKNREGFLKLQHLFMSGCRRWSYPWIVTLVFGSQGKP